MNTRTGELAADVAFERENIPTPPVALMLGYNGAARPTPATLARWGLPVLLGFESIEERAYAGGDAGERDSAFSCESFDEVGYPRTCGSWLCAADRSSTPAQYLANITDYGYRYALRQIAGGRSGPIAGYGNPAAVEALAAGIRAAGLTALRWGVGTWGYGEGGGPNMPPAQADAELVQSGNTPGPVAGTDLNWLYVPVATFAAMNGPTDTPATPKRSTMELIVGTLFNGAKIAVLLEPGGEELGRWTGPDAGFGVPAGTPLLPGATRVDIPADRPEILTATLDVLERRKATGTPAGESTDLGPVRVHLGNLSSHLGEVADTATAAKSEADAALAALG